MTYLYIAQVAATDVDTRGLTVTGAVAGTTVLLSYNFALRRIDGSHCRLMAMCVGARCAFALAPA